MVIAFGSAVLLRADDTAAGVVLLTLGIVLAFASWLGPRLELESVEVLGAKVRVREVVERRLELAQGAAPHDPADPRDPRKQAAVLQELESLHRLYAFVRKTQAGGPERTNILDRLSARMQQAAGEAEFDHIEVMNWFHDGNDALRVVALNVMIAREECRNVLVPLEALDDPHSAFEQFYALLLAEKIVHSEGELERRLLKDAVERAQARRRFRRDGASMAVSRRILAETATRRV